jgi:hypothetical protein
MLDAQRTLYTARDQSANTAGTTAGRSRFVQALGGGGSTQSTY